MIKEAGVIIGLMEEEVKIYGEFNELATKKQEAIEAEDIESLDKLVKLEQALIMKVSRIETKRKNIIIDYANENDVKPNEIEGIFSNSLDEISKARMDMLKK